MSTPLPQKPYEYVHPSSARSAYPVFLSLHETLWLQTEWFLRGLFDAFRWDIVVRTASSDPEIRSNMLNSLRFNALFWTSAYTSSLIFQSLVDDHSSWFEHKNVRWLLGVGLLLVVGVYYYPNVSWCNNIAKRTFVLQHGKSASQQQPETYTGMLTMLATLAYRIVMVLTLGVVSFALGAIPYGGPLIRFAFLCWIDAYYCFEFIWIVHGLSLSKRVRYLEERWSYFFAFGIPFGALRTWGMGLSWTVFDLLFPAYIIMAMHARPVPQDPFNPQAPSEKKDTVRYPLPLIPIRLPIFAAVIWFNDLIVWIFSIGGSLEEPRHKKVPSKSSERAEEEAEIELHRVPPGTNQQALSPGQPIKQKVIPNSPRRKRD